MPKKRTVLIHNPRVHTWRLVKDPVSVRLVYFEALRQLSLSASSNRSSKWTAHARIGVRLSRSESHDFFRKLGRALGYEMPKSRLQIKRRPLIVVKERRVRGQKGKHSRTGGILIKVLFGPIAMRAPGPGGRIAVRLTRRKAHDLFKSLAPVLGWELYEKEVWV